MDSDEIRYTQTTTPGWNQFDYFALSVCLMFGTASLPHVLMRYFTTPSVKTARKSVAWSLFFIFLLYVSAPAYAAYAKFEVLDKVISNPIHKLNDWVFKYGAINMVSICHPTASKDDYKAAKAINQTTVITNCQAKQDLIDDCKTTAASRDFWGDKDCTFTARKDRVLIDENYKLKNKDFWINNDIVVVAAPDASGQPFTIVGLVAAGGLAASLSTADGLLLAIANALSHDIFTTLVWPCFSDEEPNTLIKLGVARVFLLAVAALAATIASLQLTDILTLVAWAFSLACGGQFPALSLGVWWKGTTPCGAVWGMIAGFSVTLFYLAGTQFGGMEKWFGMANISSAIFGMPVGFVVTILVSLCTPKSPQDVLDLVDSLREPEKEAEMELAGEEKEQETIELGIKEEVEDKRHPNFSAIEKKDDISNGQGLN